MVSVFLNKGRKLHTTRSWDFIMELDHVGSNPSSSIWKKARYGEDTIIGNLDTGEYFSLGFTDACTQTNYFKKKKIIKS